MIPFTKAHACGNDFLIVTEDAAAHHDRANLARHLCSRNTGIGADGIEFFAWTGQNAGRIRLHNADGSIAEISGNGTRCVAAFMAQVLNSKPGEAFEIATDAGPRCCIVNTVTTTHEFLVEVTAGMGIPTVTPSTVTLSGGEQIAGLKVSTGNPHFVIRVDSPEFANLDFDLAGQSWQSIGQQICVHPDFPNQTNVEFLRVVSPTQIEIRIFERGVGPTTSSGTGSSATAAASIAVHCCLSPLTVVAPGGSQSVEWHGPGNELYLTGPAALIARGEAWFK